MSDNNEYEARREAERTAQANRAAAFGVLLSAVAVELAKLEGKPWKFVPSEHENYVRPYGELQSDGLALSVSQFQDGYNANAKERISVQGSWPREKNGPHAGLREYGVIPYGETEPKITVAANGTAERIAKDVQRRLIDGEDLRGKYAKVLEAIASRNAYANQQEALAASLFEAAGIAQPPKNEYRPDARPTIRLYDFAPGVSYGDIEVRGADSVQINVSVNGEIAKAFLKFLKARKASKAAA